jgi:hypothetical protein
MADGSTKVVFATETFFCIANADGTHQVFHVFQKKTGYFWNDGGQVA